MSEEVITTEESTQTTQEVKIKVRLHIYLTHRDSYLNIDMGVVTQERFQELIQLSQAAFNNIKVNNSLSFMDERGELYLFNVDNVACIQVVAQDVH